MTAAIDPLLTGLGRKSPLPSSTMTSWDETAHWTVRSLDSLNLSLAGLTLSQQQLTALPKSIVKKVYEGFSRVVQNNNQMIPGHINSLRFSVVADRLELKTKSGAVIASVSYNEDHQLQKALGKVVDQARIYFPAACSESRTLETAKASIPEKQKVQPSIFNLSCVSNVNSIGRNTLSALKMAGSTVAVSGLYGGISSGYIGRKVFLQGKDQLIQAWNCGDNQGMVDGFTTAGTGAFLGGVGVTAVAGFLPKAIPQLKAALSKVPDISKVIGVTGNAFTIGMASFMLINATYNWVHLSSFRDELSFIIDDQNLKQKIAKLSDFDQLETIWPFTSMSEAEIQELKDLHGEDLAAVKTALQNHSDVLKAQRGITFLSQQICVTEGEVLQLQKKYGHDPKALQKAIQNKAAEKRARLVRRVGEDCANKIAEQIDAIGSGLTTKDADAVCKAIDLLNEVDLASYKVRVKLAIQFVLSLLYLTVGILACLTPAGLAVPILFVVGAAIFTLIDSKNIHNFVSQKIFNLRAIPKKRWSQPLAERSIKAISTSGFHDGQLWQVGKVKERVVQAFKKAQTIDLTYVLQNGGEEKHLKVGTFEDLCHLLRVDPTLFDRKAAHYEELTLKQIRVLRFFELLQQGILEVDQRNAARVYQNELLNLGFDVDAASMAQEISRASQITTLTFNEDPALPIGQIEISSDNVFFQQLIDAG